MTAPNTSLACAAAATLALVPAPAPVSAASDPASSIRLVNVGSDVGLDVRVAHGGPAKRWIAEANGSGAAVFDFDGDGWMDIVIVSGSTMESLRAIAAGRRPANPGRGVHLFRNLEGRRFEDVTEEAGLTCPYWCTGANAADFDNDGDPDVLVTAIGRDLLYRNEGDGRFAEVGEQAGLQEAHAWHAGSSFGDVDADGDLDLYVAAYLGLESLPVEGEPPSCDYRGLDVFCGPAQLEPAADVLYLNNGDGTFSEASDQAGIRGPQPAYGFTPLIADFSGDGRPDIFVANDSSPNFLFVNRGSGSFREDALVAGLAYSGDGRTQADMGACAADYDGDADLDLLTTTFSEDHFPLFEQQAPGLFEDVSSRVGLRNLTVPLLGWGCGFADLDNDGDPDLWIANGHVYPSAGNLATTRYHQRIAILENRAGRFRLPVQAVEEAPRNSYRGAASSDFDNDGGVDLLLLPIDGSPALLRNRSRRPHSWIGIRLVAASGNGEGIGARVEARFCGQTQVAAVRNGGSYLSRSDPRVHFGLGGCSEPGQVTVRWPDGPPQVLGDVSANQWLTVRGSRGPRR